MRTPPEKDPCGPMAPPASLRRAWRVPSVAGGGPPAVRGGPRSWLVPGIGTSSNRPIISNLRNSFLPEPCFLGDLGQRLFCNLLKFSVLWRSPCPRPVTTLPGTPEILFSYADIFCAHMEATSPEHFLMRYGNEALFFLTSWKKHEPEGLHRSILRKAGLFSV